MQIGPDSYMTIDDAPYAYNYNYKMIASYYQVKKKEDEEKEMKYYFYVRFANSKNGSFSNSTTTYTYEVSLGHYEYFHIGDIVNIQRIKYEDKFYTPNYSTTLIRIEGKQAFQKDSIPERIKASAIKYATQIGWIKGSTEPPGWFDNFIEKNKYTLKLQNNPVTDKLTCYYRDSNGLLFTYNEIIEGFYKPLICEQKPLGLTYELTDEQIKSMLANSVVQAPELSINKITFSEEELQGLTQSTINQWCDLHLKTTTTKEKKMEEKEMTMFDNITKNMKFGKYETGNAKYSINGIAFRDEKGGYFVYTDNVATDVTGMTIDMPLFCMPVALSQIAANDIILFKDKIVIVKEKTNDGIKIVYPLTSEIKVIIPEKNMFGFDYLTKIINPFEQFMTAASKDNPFGNFLPLMMFGDKVDDDSLMKIMMFSQMGQGDFMNNPMMMYMLMKDGKSNDFLLAMMLAKGGALGIDLAQLKTE